jgi:hypothetical protein
VPARIHFDDDAVTAALVSTGGAIAAAAHQLGVSPRTLQRRLKARPQLVPEPSSGPEWAEAIRRWEEASNLAEYSLQRNDGRPFWRFEREAAWTRDEVEAEPRRMTEGEVASFLADVMVHGCFYLSSLRR